MQRLLQYDRMVEKRYAATHTRPHSVSLVRSFLPKKHLNVIPHNVGGIPDYVHKMKSDIVMSNVDVPLLHDAAVMTDVSHMTYYQEKLNELQIEHDITDAILDERTIELETVRDKLNNMQTLLDAEMADNEYTKNKLHEANDKNQAMDEMITNVRREMHYYQYRMEQEKQLNRQLLLQVESLKKNQRLPEPEAADEPADEAANEAADEAADEAAERSPILSRKCIVCNELCSHYEEIPCNHPICTECYVHWFASRMQYNDTLREGEAPVVFSCPLCRTPINTL